MNYPEWGNLEPCYLVVASTPEGIRRDNEHCRRYYDVVYDKFMDKVKDRHKMELKEWHEITGGIFEQFPDVKPYVINAIIQRHGWELWYEGDGDMYEMMRSQKGWVYKIKTKQ